jgi:hypothetical protein
VIVEKAKTKLTKKFKKSGVIAVGGGNDRLAKMRPIKIGREGGNVGM